MRRSWIGLVVVLVLIAGAIGAAWYWGDGGWGPRHTTDVVRLVNPDGSAVGNGQTVVIESHRGGPFFFFPFGIFFFFFLLFILSRIFFWGRGGRRWNGPGPGDTPPAWFDAWHRQAHERDRLPAPDSTADSRPGSSESDQSKTR